MSFQSMSSRALLAAALASLLGLAACGSGSSSAIAGTGGNGNGGGGTGTPPPITNTDCDKPTTNDDGGCAFVSLTDAAGDFLTYTVGVTKITLTRRDGAVVSVLPKSATVDFAQYTDLSEFLTLNAIPVGDYQSGVITLDYRNADIEDQDTNGDAVKLKPVDAGGAAITTLDVTVNFDTNHPFGAVKGVPHTLGIDFNLDSSNTVNNGKQTVTVQPFLIARVDDADGKEQLVRGPLSSVDITGKAFTLGLRPFRANSDDYGKVPVHTTAATTFIIDQKIYTGSTGLTALKLAGSDTAVLAQGSFDFSTHRFVADQVMAGSSVAGGTLDAAEGVVTARSGNTLTLRGATLYRTGASIGFHDALTVDVGSGTTVREIDKLSTHLADGDISVGQHLLVFGNLTGSTTLDATGGFALLEFTRVDGSVLIIDTAGTNASVTLDVQAIEGHTIGEFHFGGTGSDHSNYQVELPCSCLSEGVSLNDPVRIEGFVTPFGSAQPDFEAQTLTDYENVDALVTTTWLGSGTADAFTSLDTGGLALNLASSPFLHRLRQGGLVTDLNSLPNSPVIKGKAVGTYAILQGGVVKTYFSFSRFISALQGDMAGGAKVRGVFATGGFSTTTDDLSADGIAVVLH